MVRKKDRGEKKKMRIMMLGNAPGDESTSPTLSCRGDTEAEGDRDPDKMPWRCWEDSEQLGPTLRPPVGRLGFEHQTMHGTAGWGLKA